jgi:hypothetical protein
MISPGVRLALKQGGTAGEMKPNSMHAPDKTNVL